MTDQPDKPAPGAPRSTQDDEARRLPKRFYSEATTVNHDAGFAIQLDGRTIKTPSREALVVPTEPLAQAIAAEWNALGDEIDPEKLPLTKIANTAIDGVRAREREVHDDIVRYIGNDLLFYRAETPGALAARQAEAWDPILAWFAETFGAEFKTTAGIMPIEQNMVSIAKAASALTNETAMSLAPLHLMTTLTGSALLTIAHLKGHLTTDQVWHATHVDEDWQIEQWGHDDEAAERRSRRRNELQNTADFLAMLRR
jgi:chaperone required for assembly of F1-ATPase